jgi:hypothetical protein
VPLYNWVLGALLVAVTVAGCSSIVRQGNDETRLPSRFALAWGFLVLIALPFLPLTMNGSGFFAARFSIWPPLLFLAAAASVNLRRQTKHILLGVAIGITAFTLFQLSAHIGPIAQELDLSKTPRGVLKGEHLKWATDSRVPGDITFDPYVLAAVRAVDREDAILVDSPWMDLQIMMLEEIGPKAPFDPVIPAQGKDRLGIAVSRCGMRNIHNSHSRLQLRDPQRWRNSRYGCIDIFLP